MLTWWVGAGSCGRPAGIIPTGKPLRCIAKPYFLTIILTVSNGHCIVHSLQIVLRVFYPNYVQGSLSLLGSWCQEIPGDAPMYTMIRYSFILPLLPLIVEMYTWPGIIFISLSFACFPLDIDIDLDEFSSWDWPGWIFPLDIDLDEFLMTLTWMNAECQRPQLSAPCKAPTAWRMGR